MASTLTKQDILNPRTFEAPKGEGTNCFYRGKYASFTPGDYQGTNVAYPNTKNPLIQGAVKITDTLIKQ